LKKVADISAECFSHHHGSNDDGGIQLKKGRVSDLNVRAKELSFPFIAECSEATNLDDGGLILS